MKETKTQKITMTAIFIGVALVLRLVFPISIPLFGQNGMKVGLSGIFTALPALLFGPIFGAAASGLYDILAFVLRPDGAYLFPMLAAVTFGGFLRGALWIALKKVNTTVLRIFIGITSSLSVIFGISNIICFKIDGITSIFYENNANISTEGLTPIGKMLITRTSALSDPSIQLNFYITLLTYGIIALGLVGISLLIVDLFASKQLLKRGMQSNALQILITIITAGIVVTTINTVILREMFFTGWKALPFSFVLIPRIIEELLSGSIEVYILALLMNVYQRNFKK